MLKKPPNNAAQPQQDAKPSKKHSGRRSDPISLAPLTPDQAMSALLKVKLSDVKKLEAAEAQGKKK